MSQNGQEAYSYTSFCLTLQWVVCYGLDRALGLSPSDGIINERIEMSMSAKLNPFGTESLIYSGIRVEMALR